MKAVVTISLSLKEQSRVGFLIYSTKVIVL